MGMESFFVTILPKDVILTFSKGIRCIKGNDNSFDVPWGEILKNKFCVKIHDKNSFIIDNCVEMQLKKTKNNTNSYYCILKGCFSCFEEAIDSMRDVINEMSKYIGVGIKVDILGKVNIFDEGEFCLLVKNAYRGKLNEFVKNYGEIKLLVSPDSFYKEYKKFCNPIMRLLYKVKGGLNNK